MPRKRKEQLFDPSRQIEAGQSTVRLDGVGEDQVVKDLLSPEFATKSDKEVLDIANSLREILTGQRVLGERLGKMEERIAKYEKDEQAWDTDRKNFVEGLMRKADAVRVPDSQKAAVQAKAGQQIQQIYQKAQMDGAMKRRKFEEDLKYMPKVTVTSPGVVHIVAGQPRLEPEVIQIKNKRWIFQPGVPQTVPDIVAKELEQRHRVEMETSERKNLLSRQLEDKTVATAWNDISNKYNPGAGSERETQFPV